MFLQQKAHVFHVKIHALQVHIIWGVIVKRATLYAEFAVLENFLGAKHPTVQNVLIPARLEHILPIAINPLEVAFAELAWLAPTVFRNPKLVTPVQRLVKVAHM